MLRSWILLKHSHLFFRVKKKEIVILIYEPVIFFDEIYLQLFPFFFSLQKQMELADVLGMIFFFWTNFLQSFEWNKDCDSDIWMYNFWMLMLLNTVIVGRLCRIGRQPRCTLLRAAARRSATSSAASDAKKKEERILCSRNFSLADNVIIFKPAFV